MKWTSVFWLPFVAGCRMTKFLKEEGVELQNHVMKTVDASAPVKCRSDCMDIPLCFSINVRKLPTGRVTCDLNNSSKTADPQDLIQREGSQYHQMMVSGSVSVSKHRFSFVITIHQCTFLLRIKTLTANILYNYVFSKSVSSPVWFNYIVWYNEKKKRFKT